jgi:hypothetical protein
VSGALRSQRCINGFVRIRFCVTSSSDADEGNVNAVDELQDFVSKVYKNTLKQRSFELYFRKQ